MELRDRFLEAIDYIEGRLLEPVHLSEVAERSGFSPPYFSRLFRVLTGEPFGNYLRRRRLTVAAARLLDTGRPVTLQTTVAWIWGTWLPASSFDYAPGPDFEAYPEGFEPSPGNTIDICIPVRPRSSDERSKTAPP